MRDNSINLNFPGIYKITNIVNGKFYIGSAASTIRKRRKNHRYYLKLGTHCNLHLQRAYDKYGEDSFIVTPLLATEDIKMLTKIEQFYIDTLKPEYNIRKTAGSFLGMKHSEETKAKIKAYSKTDLAKERRAKSKTRGKPVLRLDPKTKAYKIYNSGAEADRDGFSGGCINLCCLNKLVTHRDFLWCFYDRDADINLQIDKLMENGWDIKISVDPEVSKRRGLSTRKPVRRTNIKTGEIQIFSCLSEAKIPGVGEAKIDQCIKGKIPSWGGFLWERVSKDIYEQFNNKDV